MTNPPLPIFQDKETAALIKQAQQAYDYADHAMAADLYARLIQLYPDHPVIRRNALVSMEYDPMATPADRLAAAKAWGQWITQGVRLPRPMARPLVNRQLRVGYVSADICQHTVGMLVKDVLMAHNPDRVIPFIYSAGSHEDWVTRKVARATRFRDAQALDDLALAQKIQEDQIDVLVDLSGHTAGSRLSVFSLRPAPVQISWLGYFASTGLDTMDAVLLDPWHHTPDIKTSFCERIIDLPSRFCFQPAPFAPEVAPLPALHQGHITFGSFNNTAKLNTNVLALWARTLAACPDSRLVLKWRTLNDAALRDKISQAFSAAGISPHRLEFRGASSHVDLLKEYADIDIALDPFPFCGGLTTCEALWMGVPVITLPQGRVVSRQSTSILNLIGHPEWIASSPSDYIRLALSLATKPNRLCEIRNTLRQQMRQSPLMSIAGFISSIEDSLIEMFESFGEKNT